MKSYLLSGWRIWLPDENGHSLYRGRVYFYDASTSEPSEVFQEKEQETSFGTYVDVNNHGYLPPIWLDASHLYKCVVKRKIQDDPETWQTLWEINDVGNPFLTSDNVEGVKTIFVNTISDLKSLDTDDEEIPEYVQVFGWYTPGDTGSPMLFRLIKNFTGTRTNDGHWVYPNTKKTDIWEQIFDDEIDPRKFGAIPDNGISVDEQLKNCMLYASEPHTYDSSDSTYYRPRIVKFVKSGTYKLSSEFDFTLYKMINAFGNAPVPVIIQDGVYFNKKVVFGKGHKLESSQVVSFSLEIEEDSMEYVRPQWFNTHIQAGIFAAMKTKNNCKVYDVSNNYIQTFLSGMVIGEENDNHWLEFCDNTFLFDTDEFDSPITFNCIVKCDKYKSLIKVPKRSVSNETERQAFKSLNPFLFKNVNQIVSDYWFGIGIIPNDVALIDHLGLLLSWCANCGATNFDLIGGYVVETDVQFNQVYYSDLDYVEHAKVKLQKPLKLKAKLTNLYLTNIGELCFINENSGKVELLNDVVFVEWFKDVDETCLMCIKTDVTLTQYRFSYVNVNTANLKIKFKTLKDLKLRGNNTNLNISIYSECIENCDITQFDNIHLYSYNGILNVLHSKFENANILIYDIENNVINFLGNIFNANETKQILFNGLKPNDAGINKYNINICNNVFSGKYYLQLGEVNQDWENALFYTTRNIIIENNINCELSTQSFTVIEKTAKGTLLYFVEKENGSWKSTSAKKMVAFAIPTNKYKWSKHCLVTPIKKGLRVDGYSYETKRVILGTVDYLDPKTNYVIYSANFIFNSLNDLQDDVSKDGFFLLTKLPTIIQDVSNSDIFLTGDVSNQVIEVSNGVTDYSNTNEKLFEVVYLPSIGGYQK